MRNNIELDEKQNIILLTGPNMGGKSTILRQTALLAIIAQIGCFVPADKLLMSPVESIFTRIGASDRLIEGKSTFYVEMEELKTILNDGNKNSLAIIDELGRGTNTCDGIKICKAAIEELSEPDSCFVLLTTHYHELADFVENFENVKKCFMGCEIDESKKEIAFEYKLKQGSCPKSFGIHVAKLAGIPNSIVEKAFNKVEIN